MTSARTVRVEWREGLVEEYAWLAERTRGTVSCIDLELQLPWIDAIRTLKAEVGATILAHNYQPPEIFHGVADITGDSLALADAAGRCDSDTLIVCGVAFMAETVKLLAPAKQVLTPAPNAGCSLASSITAADVRALREANPGVPVVAYINTTAAVKAEVDICCTSANAAQVVASLGVPRVIFVPDRHLAAQVARDVDVELVVWPGACEVHERFSAADVRALRADDGIRIIAHPECRDEVCELADFVGSTAAMGRWIQVHEPDRVALITECSMGDNLRSSFPDVEFVRSCQLCPHMKKIDLPSIHTCLVHGLHEVHIPEDIARRARLPIERMLSIGRQDRV